MPHLSRKGPAMSTIRQVASGVHLVELAHVNCYLIEDDDGVTLVDTGLPDHWRGIQQALRHMGKTPGDVRAVVLTHAHFDHMGTAQRWQQEMRVPMWIHDEEMYLAAHPYRYAHENPRALYPLRHPRAVPILFAIARHGALRVKGVDGLNTLAAGEGLDVPGRPRPVFSPGHPWSLRLPPARPRRDHHGRRVGHAGPVHSPAWSPDRRRGRHCRQRPGTPLAGGPGADGCHLRPPGAW